MKVPLAPVSTIISNVDVPLKVTSITGVSPALRLIGVRNTVWLVVGDGDGEADEFVVGDGEADGLAVGDGDNGGSRFVLGDRTTGVGWVAIEEGGTCGPLVAVEETGGTGAGERGRFIVFWRLGAGLVAELGILGGAIAIMRAGLGLGLGRVS